MTMTNCIVLIAAALLSSAILSEAFTSRPSPIQNVGTALHLKSTVPTRFPFRPNKSEHNIEHIAEDNEEVYHRRIVHFELSSEHTHATSNNENTQTMRKYRNKSSSNVGGSENRRFGWDHRDFMQSVDP